MAKGRKRKKQQAEAARATGSKKKAKLPDDPSPPQQQHRVRVLASAERFAALLEILNAPSAEPRAAVVFAGTKAGCDQLGAALGQAGWPSEVVHGNKRRDEQEASLRAFAAGECRCLVATEAAARRLPADAFADGPQPSPPPPPAVDVLVNYELPEDFFVRPAAAHRAFIRRLGGCHCTTFLRTDSFGDTDVKAAHPLLNQLQAEFPQQAVPAELAALDPGFSAVSARQARQGLLTAAAGATQAQEPRLPDPAVRSTHSGSSDVRLVFCLVVSGRPTDRSAGAAFASSWAGFDQSFRGRRDALSRCLSAALWSRPGAEGVAPAVAYSDREVWLVFEEPPVTVVRVTSDWARCVGASTAPTEHVLLSALDEAIRGRRPAAGLHLDPEPYDTVRAAVAALLGRHRAAAAAAPSRRDVLLELHDSQDASLPVYSGASSASASPEIGSVVVALGCVEDHLDSIAAIVDEGSRLGYDVGRVNLGPLTEFSSKIVHIVQAHHDAGRLLPAVAELLRCGGQSAEPAGSTVWREKARAPRKGGGLMGERVASAGAPNTAVCDLHFCESFTLIFRGCSLEVPGLGTV